MCLERNVGFSLLLQLQVATVSSAIHIYGLSPAVLAETYVAGQTSRYKVSLKSVHSFSNWYMRKGRQGTANGALWHLFNLFLFYLPVVGVEGYWCWSHSDTHTHNTHTHTRQDTSGRVIGPSKRPLYLHNTQHSQETTFMPRRDSKPQSQQASGRRHMPFTPASKSVLAHGTLKSYRTWRGTPISPR